MALRGTAARHATAETGVNGKLTFIWTTFEQQVLEHAYQHLLAVVCSMLCSFRDTMLNK